MTTTTMTPREVDTRLSELYHQAARAEQRQAAATGRVHMALGERMGRVGRRRMWPTTDVEALTAARAKVAEPDYQEHPWHPSLVRALADYDAAAAALAAVKAEAAPLNAEYDRRRWSRFFVVQQHNGHVHSSMRCQTCNRNGSVTSFGWNPDLSGLTEEAAVAKLGPMLCTVCFPSAPVEWTVGRPANHCSGSGQAPANKATRCGMNYYAACRECGETQLVTANGGVRKHQPPKK